MHEIATLSLDLVLLCTASQQNNAGRHKISRQCENSKLLLTCDSR